MSASISRYLHLDLVGNLRQHLLPFVWTHPFFKLAKLTEHVTDRCFLLPSCASNQSHCTNIGHRQCNRLECPEESHKPLVYAATDVELVDDEKHQQLITETLRKLRRQTLK